ncbi:MbcA/ParS/Xre antitoxin family protein [Massilia pinisoli]|uniref:MbcA/ParS/Xre antitoxin family protein n=1 Tax=Massilia pinisoli TaxID=1772194 RepID=A0ABT1ZTX8_9BURK|nr:MbcA/ParS/Xre antitoxin family protein [Massilia pinisoli]MCS0583392.1 MbcA/ParS/Xre antitoxin family protein [Massilia pinisoli]
MAEEDDRPRSPCSYDEEDSESNADEICEQIVGRHFAKNEQGSGPSADEICEQVVGSHFAKTWGERPLNAAPLELPDVKKIHRSANTMYVAGLTKLADITDALVERILPNDQPVHPKIPAEVLARRDEIRNAALEKLGSPQQAKKWLEGPKVSLQGRRPVDLLGTLEGCDQVQKMLDDLYS